MNARTNKNNERTRPSKKITVNLAIDEFVVNSLKKDSEAKGISLNAKINGILTKYVNCYQRTEEYESCIIPSRTFAVFLEMLDESRTIEAMKTDGTDGLISYFQHYNIPMTLESIIEVAFENIVLITGVCTKFSQHTDQEGYRCLIFDHRYGIKWSRIISKIFSDLLKRTCDIDTTSTLLPNTISMKILQRY